jgi:cytochrome P450
MVLPWLVHRDPRWWPEPWAFKPERWIDAPRPARFTYLPFGGGPRVCIGNHFARMEAVLVLTTLARALRIKVAPGFEIVPRPSITLRLAGPAPAQVDVR